MSIDKSTAILNYIISNLDDETDCVCVLPRDLALETIGEYFKFNASHNMFVTDVAIIDRAYDYFALCFTNVEGDILFNCEEFTDFCDSNTLIGDLNVNFLIYSDCDEDFSDIYVMSKELLLDCENYTIHTFKFDDKGDIDCNITLTKYSKCKSLCCNCDDCDESECEEDDLLDLDLHKEIENLHKEFKALRDLLYNLI